MEDNPTNPPIKHQFNKKLFLAIGGIIFLLVLVLVLILVINHNIAKTTPQNNTPAEQKLEKYKLTRMATIYSELDVVLLDEIEETVKIIDSEAVVQLDTDEGFGVISISNQPETIIFTISDIEAVNFSLNYSTDNGSYSISRSEDYMGYSVSDSTKTIDYKTKDEAIQAYLKLIN